MDDLAGRKDYRMTVIFDAIRIATRHECSQWRKCSCPKLRKLWLEMIEGNDPTDDVWLWMDGDEQWLREKFDRWKAMYPLKVKGHKGDWIDAYSALRRRIHQPRNNAGQLAERIRNATPKQRVAAICWLTCNSGRVKALAIELGCTPLGMFGPGEIVENYRTYTIRDLWGAFLENTPVWEEATKKLRENGCTCLVNTRSSEAPLQAWFNMLTWLDGKPPTLEAIGGGGCTRCQSWCVLRLASSLHCDKDSEGRSHAMTSLDTGLRAHIRRSYGIPYVSMLFWTTTMWI